MGGAVYSVSARLSDDTVSTTTLTISSIIVLRDVFGKNDAVSAAALSVATIGVGGNLLSGRVGGGEEDSGEGVH